MNYYSNRIQILSIFFSVIFILFILHLIRKKKIKEEYSLLWLFSGIVFLFFSIWRNALEYLAKILGIDYTPAALFLILFGSIYLLLIHFSTVLSKLSEQNKKLVQEVALLQIKDNKNNTKKTTVKKGK